jgi:hypothetical protein
MHRGLPYSGLSSSKLIACGPPETSCSTFSSFETSPPMSGPTCDGDRRILNNEELFKF